MSLLLKALQNAAKSREASAPEGERAVEQPVPAREAGAASGELALEPVQPSTRAQAAARATSPPRSARAPADEPVERTPAGPSPSQAQAVLRAGAPAQRDGVFSWFAQRPLVAFSTAAGLFAIGYGVYLYLQLTNPGVFTAPVPPAPPPPAAPAPVATAPAPAPPAAPAPPSTPAAVAPPPGPEAVATPAAPAASVATAAPAQPSAAAPLPGPATTAVTQPPAAPAAAAPAATATRPPAVAPSAGQPPAASAPAAGAAPAVAVAAERGAPRTAAPRQRPAAPAATPVARRESAERVAPGAASQVVPVDASLASAYQALERGQFDDAERLYRQALASNPRSVDAMLGLATVLTQQNKGDAATQLYLRVLEQEPRNAYAQAGLLNITGRADPVAAEARLKQLIAREPSAFLYFTLGNLYAEQRQWAGAQAAYFQAFNLAPDNPDYAFNLAVGLEHLSQPKLALDYYRRAVTLAQSRGHAQFETARVQTRIRSLEAALAQAQ